MTTKFREGSCRHGAKGCSPRPDKPPPAIPKPNMLTLEQAFEIMFEKYKDSLEELADK